MIRIVHKLSLLLICMVVLFASSCSDSAKDKNAIKKKNEQESLQSQSDLKQKKVLYVDSYHRGYEWSDGITSAILSTFNANLNSDGSVDNSNSLVQLKIVRMDTKRNKSEAFKRGAALKVKKIIDDWKPDLVIVSDDNASKYLVIPYYKDGEIPFVFCGVNGSADKYGYPFSNVTGMVEVLLIKQLVSSMEGCSKGNRLAFLAGRSTTCINNLEFFRNVLHRDIDARFVDNFKAWKQEFIKIQKEADMLLITNGAAIKNWSQSKAKQFIYENATIPIGGWDAWNADLLLLTYAQDPAEQGAYAARTAIRILKGEDIKNIPCVKNKNASIILNMKLAKKLGIRFRMELINRSTLIGFE